MLKATADEVATREVEAPVGPLGLELANSNSGVVVVKSLSGSSPLHLIVGVGWHLVSVDGASVSTFSEPSSSCRPMRSVSAPFAFGS